MVDVFREVRRVMHPTGLLFLNLGDSYGGHGSGVSGKHAYRKQERTSKPPGPDGQLLNMPHRVAEALRADGWIWRQTIVWAKRSPMPESCRGWRWERCRVKVAPGDTSANYGRPGRNHRPGNFRNETEATQATLAEWADCPGCPKCEPNGGLVLRKGRGRCTTAHEYLFVLCKSDSYFWDSAAFAEESSGLPGGACIGKVGSDGPGSRRVSEEENAAIRGGTRNPRTVWTLSSEPCSLPHFATYPSELVRRCIQAGTSDGGCCPNCLEPWAPVVEIGALVPDSPGYKPRGANRPAEGVKTGLTPAGETQGHPNHHYEKSILGYRPTCECLSPGNEDRFRCGTPGWLQDNEAAIPTPCTVLDPFAGIGTTLQTAQWMGRDSIGIELNPEYAEHARARIDKPPVWWYRESGQKKRPTDDPGQQMMFEE